MANYKNIVDVDVLAEASESTNVLVEENGSLKKVPASAVGGSAGGGSPVVLFIKDGNSLHCEYTAAQIAEMMSFTDGTIYITGMPTFMLSDSADCLFPTDGSAGLVDFPMIPCIMVRPYFAIHDTGALLLANIDLTFCDRNDFKVMILPEDNEIKLKFADK